MSKLKQIKFQLSVLGEDRILKMLDENGYTDDHPNVKLDQLPFLALQSKQIRSFLNHNPPLLTLPQIITITLQAYLILDNPEITPLIFGPHSRFSIEQILAAGLPTADALRNRVIREKLMNKEFTVEQILNSNTASALASEYIQNIETHTDGRISFADLYFNKEINFSHLHRCLAIKMIRDRIRTGELTLDQLNAISPNAIIALETEAIRARLQAEPNLDKEDYLSISFITLRCLQLPEILALTVGETSKLKLKDMLKMSEACGCALLDKNIRTLVLNGAIECDQLLKISMAGCIALKSDVIRSMVFCNLPILLLDQVLNISWDAARALESDVIRALIFCNPPILSLEEVLNISDDALDALATKLIRDLLLQNNPRLKIKDILNIESRMELLALHRPEIREKFLSGQLEFTDLAMAEVIFEHIALIASHPSFDDVIDFFFPLPTQTTSSRYGLFSQSSTTESVTETNANDETSHEAKHAASVSVTLTN